MEKVILYSTNCSKCKILEEKLNYAGIKYEVCPDIKIMLSKGYKSAPMLEVDGKSLTFLDAINYVKGI